MLISPVDTTVAPLDPLPVEQFDPAKDARKANVKRWLDKIDSAKKKWSADFERMRRNLKFVKGIQWEGQEGIESKKYVANLTIRAINQKVAMLYARNPKVVASKRERMDFALWDEKPESIVEAIESAQIALSQLGSIPPGVNAVLNDYEQGRERRKIYDRVGKTLTIASQYQMDTQTPEFKTQAKQLVRRVCVCGVGYIRVDFERTLAEGLTQSQTRSSVLDRVRQLQGLTKSMEKDGLGEESAEYDELQQLMLSTSMAEDEYDSVRLRERVVFDFPPATSIIPDENCRALKGFIGAKWICEEFPLPLSFVNAWYEVDIEAKSLTKSYDKLEIRKAGDVTGQEDPIVCVREVFDLATKTRFVVADGYEDYLETPAPVRPSVANFWPVEALTFNDVESDLDVETTPFPPSDVDLVFHSQKEWNRTREALRRQRRANAPRYMTPEGVLTDDDLEKLADSEDNEVVRLKGIATGVEPSKVLQAFPVAPLDTKLYDTGPLEQDIMFATGLQQANLGNAQPDVTATVGTIAEQSRMTVSASNVDDLDDCLSHVMNIAGQIMLQEFSEGTIRAIVGPGAVWPTVDKSEYLSEICLQIEAASSGRPNKAIEVANWERLAPILLQVANPTAVLKETIRRLDDKLDPIEFYPRTPMLDPVQGAGQPQMDAQPSQPLEKGSSGVAVPQIGAPPNKNL